MANLSKNAQRLKSALWYAVGQIVDEECMRRNRNATPQFIGALTELVWTQIGKFYFIFLRFARSLRRGCDAILFLFFLFLTFITAENVAIDLESFANHAARSVVTTEDVLLLARKNPDLQQLMKEYIDERKTERGVRKPAAATTAKSSSGRGGRGGGGARGRGGATRISGR